MLTNFIVSLIAVFAFMGFEYLHLKKLYSFKTAWFKYVVALAVGTFAFSYLFQFKWFEYVEIGAGTFLFLFFFWIIVNALKIKGVPGQTSTPLKVVPIILVMIALSSCTMTYDNSVHAREQTQSAIGYDTTNVVNNHPTPIFDSLYTVAPTWPQAFHVMNADGNTWIFILGLVVLAGGIGFGIWLSNNTKDSNSMSPALVFCITILAGGAISGGSVTWEKWNSDQRINKTEYNQLIFQDGNLHQFWDSIYDAKPIIYKIGGQTGLLLHVDNDVKSENATITVNGSNNNDISISQSSTGVATSVEGKPGKIDTGYLSKADWSAFNKNKTK